MRLDINLRSYFLPDQYLRIGKICTLCTDDFQNNNTRNPPKIVTMFSVPVPEECRIMVMT